jgi:26S proteasome regulatory subunit N9
MRRITGWRQTITRFNILLAGFENTLIDYSIQARAEYAPYYRNSLLYLACVDLEQGMSPEERLLRAHDLGISAFLGDTIYNFGELVSIFLDFRDLIV